MTTPIDPEAVQKVLQTLPPEDPDQFPHLAFLSPDALLRKRSRIAELIKRLERERQAIDAVLFQVFSPTELHRGVRIPGGWVPQERIRTTRSAAGDIKLGYDGPVMHPQELLLLRLTSR